MAVGLLASRTGRALFPDLNTLFTILYIPSGFAPIASSPVTQYTNAIQKYMFCVSQNRIYRNMAWQVLFPQAQHKHRTKAKIKP
jgi:hypothetical protein